MPEVLQAQSQVAPVVVTPEKEFDDAVNTNSPKQMLNVAANNINNPVGVAAVKAADIMFRGEQQFNAMVAPIEKSGGMQTPEGRIVVAETAKKYFEQEDSNLKSALIHYLTGNYDMARAMVTGGTTATSVVPDIDGKLIQVTKNQLGKIVDAEEIGGRKLTQQEYQQRAVGRQTYENLLSFKSQEEQQKENIKSLKESQRINNAYAASAADFESKYTQIYDDINYLRTNGKGLSAKEYADVLKFASNSLGTAASVSKGESILGQAQKNVSANIGKNLTKEEAAAFGVDKSGVNWKYSNKGITSEDGKLSKSFDELKQQTNTQNRNDELTRNFQQTRRNLIESKKFGQLDAYDQNRLLNLLENSYQVSQKQLQLRNDHGVPTFMVLPSSIDVEDQYSVGQAKAIQGIFNAKALQLYADYERKALAQSGGIAPNPKELEAGFTRTPQYKALLDEARLGTKRVMEEPNASLGVEIKKEGPKAPPEGGRAKAPPKISLSDLVKKHGGRAE